MEMFTFVVFNICNADCNQNVVTGGTCLKINHFTVNDNVSFELRFTERKVDYSHHIKKWNGYME